MKWKARPDITIHCAVCLNMTADRVAASTVAAGYAVCEQHVKVVSVPGFSLFQMVKERRNV